MGGGGGGGGGGGPKSLNEKNVYEGKQSMHSSHLYSSTAPKGENNLLTAMVSPIDCSLIPTYY